MIFQPLDQSDFSRVLDLFCVAFQDDHYYSKLFKDPQSRVQKMREMFTPSLQYCLSQGYSCGVVEDGGRLTAFVLCFDYKKTLRSDRRRFQEIFSGSENRSAKLPYDSQLHARIRALEGDVLYLLSIAVHPDRRGSGIASALIDSVLRKYSDFHVVSDVSNEKSLGIYRKRNFKILEIDADYFLVCHTRGTEAHTCKFGSDVRVFLPFHPVSDGGSMDCTVLKEHCHLYGVSVGDAFGQKFFRADPSAIAEACLVSMPYPALLRYQRTINLSHYRECFSGDCVYYIQEKEYDTRPLLNDNLEKMIRTRKTEWSVIPDVFISVPMQYRDGDIFLSGQSASDSEAQTLLRNLDFRTQYEAGIPTNAPDVDELASLKERVKRFYLGKLKIQISSEKNVNNYHESGEPIGAAAYVDVYVSIDLRSDCAVLTWYSLSAPFLISHLLDNVIRNQVQVVEPDGVRNFFDYISEKYAMTKRGTPKAFVVIPNDRTCLQSNQLASLLAGETIYADGESFGQIIDRELMSVVDAPNGLGQYDRAILLPYTNVVLQFSPDLTCSAVNRLEEAAITLYYMELILLEEAAIHIADQSIIRLLSDDSITEPIDFLKKADHIYEDYCKTTEFWDVQVNYPTSQMSIDVLRRAFQIEKQLSFMKRNQDQLQLVFDTKCDIIDRRDSKRMNVSLAIISVLAVFSAWIDGHDYIGTWSDVFSPQVIHLLQRGLFAVILITAVYAVTHLFLTFYKRRSRSARQKQRPHRPPSDRGSL